MSIAILDQVDDINILRPVAEEWAAEAHGAEYGLPIDIEIGLETMNQLRLRNGDVLVLLSNEIVMGFLGLSYRLNHVGPGLIANECCFYVSNAARGHGLKLKKAAKKLAKAKGCNFLIWNASRVAGDADRSGLLYERQGAKQFETSYLEVL